MTVQGRTHIRRSKSTNQAAKDSAQGSEAGLVAVVTWELALGEEGGRDGVPEVAGGTEAGVNRQCVRRAPE